MALFLVASRASDLPDNGSKMGMVGGLTPVKSADKEIQDMVDQVRRHCQVSSVNQNSIAF